MGSGVGWEMLYWCARYRVQLIVLITPLLLLPLPLVIGDEASIAGYLLLLMAVYWCTDIIPLAVTGLIPVFFLPMAGLVPLKDTCYNYLDDSTMMLVGSMMVAISIEVSNLHRRVALAVLKLVGAKPQWLMFGFMIPTFILSMFINNTSTTAMMMPIMEAVLLQLDPNRDVAPPGDMDDGRSQRSNSAVEAKAYENTCIDIGDEGAVPMTLVNGEVVEGVPDTAVGTMPPVEVVEVKKAPLPADVPSGDTVSNGVADGTRIRYVSTTGSGSGDLIEPSGNAFDLAKVHEKDGYEMEATTDGAAKITTFDETHLSFENFAKALTLSVCYSANVGGVGTLTGTTPNIIMSGFVEDIWAEHGLESPVNYATWMVFGFPIACICFFVVWGWLLLFYLGIRGFRCCCCGVEGNPEQEEAIKQTIRDEYDMLGKIRYEEVASGIMFIVLIVLWFFRSPGFMPGWGDSFESGYIGDAVPAVMVAFCLYLIPADLPNSFKCGVEDESKKTEKVRVLLNWQIVHEKFPWSIIFLMGGGYALADACDVSGLSQWIGEQMTGLGSLPSFWMIFLLCIFTGLLTTVTSNSATCTILMPIMASMAESLGLNPLYLMFPVAVSCSMAFMLPVATPPNAIAYSFKRVSVLDMAKAGSVLNLVTAFVITIATETWGKAFFDFETIPWDTSDSNATTVIPP